ncbi:DMT family transporter [Pantoea ananatis]|uniref:DMT family transporter n=1 Tax=Pantoea ananas TaxID=553 RepID=UPI00221F7838|nr:DMT family transporter [Pantoea ananatis]
MASNEIRRGAAEMVVAMLMSGTIGWLVVSSGQSPFNVVFFRCLFGARCSSSARRWACCGARRSRRGCWRWCCCASAPRPWGGWRWRSSLVGVVRIAPAVLAVPGEYLQGVALALGAAFLYAVSSIVTKHLKGTPPHLLALLQLGIGIVLLAPFVRFDALPSRPGQWLDLVVLGVVNTGVMYVLLYGAIQKLPTAMTGALSFIYPVVAIAVDRIAFGQSLAADPAGADWPTYCPARESASALSRSSPCSAPTVPARPR